MPNNATSMISPAWRSISAARALYGVLWAALVLNSWLTYEFTVAFFSAHSAYWKDLFQLWNNPRFVFIILEDTTPSFPQLLAAPIGAITSAVGIALYQRDLPLFYRIATMAIALTVSALLILAPPPTDFMTDFMMD